MIPFEPRKVIVAFDEFLAARGQTLEAVVVGGAALCLMGTVDRRTKDVDVLSPRLAPHMRELADQFAARQRSVDGTISEGWLNNGPASLLDVLPDDWPRSVRVIFQGEAVTLWTLGRLDLLWTKLFALCDRFEDLDDCIALAPTSEELTAARDRGAEQDGNPLWPQHVDDTLDLLERRLRGA